MVNTGMVYSSQPPLQDRTGEGQGPLTQHPPDTLHRGRPQSGRGPQGPAPPKQRDWGETGGGGGVLSVSRDCVSEGGRNCNAVGRCSKEAWSHSTGQVPRRAVLKGGKGDLCNANRNERSQGRSLLRGHGTFSISKVGGWRSVAVGGWQLAAVGGGWCLAVGGPLGLSFRAFLNRKIVLPTGNAPQRGMEQLGAKICCTLRSAHRQHPPKTQIG